MSVSFQRPIDTTAPGQHIPKQAKSWLSFFRINAEDRFILKQKYLGKTVFIHINKCGGSSVESALHIPIKIHDTAQQRRRRLGQHWDGKFKFSFVRHPYEKVVSHYHYRIKTDQTRLGTSPISLNDWVRLAYGERDPRYYDKPLMFAPSLDWLTDPNGDLMVDYVGKLETMRQNWAIIQKRLGKHTPLPRKNATPQRAPATELLDQTSIDIINMRFAKDFRAFGYKKI